MTVDEFSIASGIEPEVISVMLSRGLLQRDVDGIRRSELHAIARCNARMTQLRAVKKEVAAQREAVAANSSPMRRRQALSARLQDLVSDFQANEVQ